MMREMKEKTMYVIFKKEKKIYIIYIKPIYFSCLFPLREKRKKGKKNLVHF